MDIIRPREIENWNCEGNFKRFGYSNRDVDHYTDAASDDQENGNWQIICAIIQLIAIN